MKKGLLLCMIGFCMIGLVGCEHSIYKTHTKTLNRQAGFIMNVSGIDFYIDNDNDIMLIGASTYSESEYALDFSGKTIYGYRIEQKPTTSWVRYEIDEKDLIESAGGDIVQDTIELCDEHQWDDSNDKFDVCQISVVLTDLPDSIIELLDELDLLPENYAKSSISLEAFYNKEEEYIHSVTINYARLYTLKHGSAPLLSSMAEIDIQFSLLDDFEAEVPTKFIESDDILTIDEFFE